MSVKPSLEDRLRAIEDRLEIYNLIASHPPSADTAGKDHITASWVEDGVFDRGENLSSPRGRDSIANQVLSADHQAAIERGLAHFTSLPHVAIEGDTAIVVLSADPGAADARRSHRRPQPRQLQGLPSPSHDGEPLGT